MRIIAAEVVVPEVGVKASAVSPGNIHCSAVVAAYRVKLYTSGSHIVDMEDGLGSDLPLDPEKEVFGIRRLHILIHVANGPAPLGTAEMPATGSKGL